MLLSTVQTKVEFGDSVSFTTEFVLYQLWFQMPTTETVHDRIEQASTELTPTQIVAGLAMVASLGFVLMFMQDPMVHDAMHSFRHGVGITCH